MKRLKAIKHLWYEMHFQIFFLTVIGAFKMSFTDFQRWISAFIK